VILSLQCIQFLMMFISAFRVGQFNFLKILLGHIACKQCIDAGYCYRCCMQHVCVSVCASVCVLFTGVNCAKMAEPVEMSFALQICGAKGMMY